MKKGIVKWFNDAKGYGFIIDGSGVEYFIHHTNIIAEGYRSLSEEAMVEFEPIATPRGPAASSVKLLQ